MSEEIMPYEFIKKHSKFINQKKFLTIQSSPATTDEAVVIKELVARHRECLKDISDQITRVPEIISSSNPSRIKKFLDSLRETRMEKRKVYPTSVKNLHLVEAIVLSSIIGAAACFLVGSFLGGFNPAVWSPSLFWIASISGILSATPSAIFIDRNLRKDYDVKSPPFGTRSMTKRSLRKYKILDDEIKLERTKANMVKLSYKDFINELLNNNKNPFLDSKGNLLKEFDYLTKSEKKELLEILQNISNNKIEMEEICDTLLGIKKTQNNRSAISQETQDSIPTEDIDNSRENRSESKSRKRK